MADPSIFIRFPTYFSRGWPTNVLPPENRRSSKPHKSFSWFAFASPSSSSPSRRRHFHLNGCQQPIRVWGEGRSATYIYDPKPICGLYAMRILIYFYDRPPHKEPNYPHPRININMQYVRLLLCRWVAKQSHLYRLKPSVLTVSVSLLISLGG